MELADFFAGHPRVALAFSGGVDSAYLLYAALAAGAQVRAYYVKTQFQPQFELDDALRLAGQLHADFTVLQLDVLAHPKIACNPKNRCYDCKKLIFSTIARAAKKDGFPVIMDGTNASDDAGERPGMRALRELAVFSPLRMCGISKAQIRERSRAAGLFTWDKPAYACLATRIRTGTAITQEKLAKTEEAEQYLHTLGFTDFRIRLTGEGAAQIQVPAEQFAQAVALRGEILRRLEGLYDGVLLDLAGRG